MDSSEPAAKQIAAKIDGNELPGSDSRTYRLAVAELKPVGPRTGWYYLAVHLCGQRGESSRTPPMSRTPLMMGIVSGGGRGVMPWFEGRLYPSVELADGIIFDARAAGLEAAFIDLLGTLVPAGGHIMIEYESPGQNETHAGLLLRVPPAATHLGALMFHAGFRGEFKDWYISEGGHEGPRKLQANKSPTAAAARIAIRAHRAELSAFIKRPPPTNPADAAIVASAQKRARALLGELRK